MPCLLCDGEGILELVHTINDEPMVMRGICPCLKELYKLGANPDCNLCNGEGKTLLYSDTPTSYIIGEEICSCVKSTHEINIITPLNGEPLSCFRLDNNTESLKSIKLETHDNYTLVTVVEDSGDVKYFKIKGGEISMILELIEEECV